MWKLTGKVEDRSEPIDEGFFDKFKNDKHDQKDTRKYSNDDKTKMKELYGLILAPVTKEYKNEKELISDIESDCKTWVNKMFQSKEYKKSSADFKKMVNVKCKYVERYRAIEVFEGPQDILSSVPFCEHLAILVESKYFKWIKDVNSGDGDEGCVYFEVRRNKDKSLAPIDENAHK